MKIGFFLFFGWLMSSGSIALAMEGRAIHEIPVGTKISFEAPLVVRANTFFTSMYRDPNRGSCDLVPSDSSSVDRVLGAGIVIVVGVKSEDTEVEYEAYKKVSVSIADESGREIPALIKCDYTVGRNQNITDNDLRGQLKFEYPKAQDL